MFKSGAESPKGDLGALFDDATGEGGEKKVMKQAGVEVGPSSPGGTKQIRLQVGFDTEAWKKQLREEAAQAAKEDALADRLTAAADVDDDAGAKEADDIRRKFGVVTSKPSRPPAKNMRVKFLDTPSASGTDVPSSQEAAGEGKTGEKFEGEFDWSNSGYDQVATLTQQNSALMSTLGQQQREIERLKELVVASEAVSGIDAERLRNLQNPDSTSGEQLDPRDAKIVDLAKKNRKVNLALERERTKVRQLSAELDKARKVNAAKTARISKLASGRAGPGAPSSQGEAGGKNNEMSAVLSQNKQMKKTVNTLKRKLEASNTDLRKVFRALQSEVGDTLSLQEVVKRGSDDGARGRAEKITKLKSRVKRLEIELERARNNAGQQQQGNDRKDSNVNAGVGEQDSALRSQHPNFQSNLRPERVEDRAKQTIASMERRRNEAADAVAQELDEMHQIAAMQKAKIDGQKARLQTLESVSRKMRGEVKVLLKKTAADDGLIDALREEIAQNRNAMATMTRKLHQLRSNAVGGTEGEFAALKQMAADQGQQLGRQEQLVSTLRSELEQLTENASKDMVAKAQKDLSLHDKNTDLALLQVENDRLTELSEMFKNKMESGKRRYEKAEMKERELERRCVELERRLGNISHGGLKRQPPADQFQALKDKLALQIEENEALKMSYRGALNSKDDELRILRALTEQQQSVYERAIKDVRAQVKLTAGQAQARIIQTQAKTDGRMMDQLQADNDHLRAQLRELQAKFKDLEHARRRRGQFQGASDYPTRSPTKNVGYEEKARGGMVGSGSADPYSFRAPLK